MHLVDPGLIHQCQDQAFAGWHIERPDAFNGQFGHVAPR
jgi:hypothetical protein